MTLTLDLPPEIEAQLRARAATAGITPEQWAIEALTDLLADDDAAEEAWAIRAYDEAQAELAAGAVPIPLAEAILMNEQEWIVNRRCDTH